MQLGLFKGNVFNQKTTKGVEEMIGRRFDLKMNHHITLAINVGIFLILLTFCALLSLPIRLLFQAKHGLQKTEVVNKSPELPQVPKESEPIKKPSNTCQYKYETLLRMLHFSEKDKNCTVRQRRKKESTVANLKMVYKSRSRVVNNDKVMPVVGQILALMLVVSVIVALAEVVKIRLFKEKVLSS